MRFQPIKKRSILMKGRKTSISVEECFWIELIRIAAEREIFIGALVAEIDITHRPTNLSSALRQFVLADVQARALRATPVLAQGAAAAESIKPPRLPAPASEVTP